MNTEFSNDLLEEFDVESNKRTYYTRFMILQIITIVVFWGLSYMIRLLPRLISSGERGIARSIVFGMVLFAVLLVNAVWSPGMLTKIRPRLSYLSILLMVSITILGILIFLNLIPKLLLGDFSFGSLVREMNTLFILAGVLIGIANLSLAIRRRKWILLSIGILVAILVAMVYWTSENI